MKYIKKELIYGIVSLVLGITFKIYKVLFNSSNEFMNIHFYFIIFGLINIFKSLILLKNPKKAKEKYLRENDERIKFIQAKVKSICFSVFAVIEFLLFVVFGLLGNKKLCSIFLYVGLGQSILWGILETYYNHKY